MKKVLQLLCLMHIAQASFAQNFGLQVDGQAGSVELCHDAEYNIGTGFTIESWIYASEWRAEAWQGSIATKDQNAPAGFAFRAGKNGTLSMVMSVDNDWFEVQSDPIMNTNQWYHVATTVADNTLSLYINGSLVNSATFAGTPNHNTQILTIGASSGFAGRNWNGILDEVRIWNVARTAAQIDDNQQTVFTGSEPGLVTYLPMNEGTGNLAENLGSVNCDGNLNGLGNNPWQDGWSIPAIDAGVTKVNAPDAISIYERPVKVSVTIQNYGSDPVANIPVELDVNGLPTLQGTYAGTIQPGETASYTFETPLDLTDNNTNLLVASTSIGDDTNGLNDSGSYRYKKLDDDTTLNILNEEPHNFGGAGQTRFTEVNMPVHMEDYEQLLLHFSLECPNDGCDPWDQPAAFFIITEDGTEYEIARFITPYGIGCGDWTVDVTDFKSIMQGEITFKSFIQVWGPSGWLVNADLEFVETATPKYQQLNELWQTQYLVYGDPAVMSDDLPEQSNTIAGNTQSGHMRMTITGHGQGNTDNAAEFSNKTHNIIVNGAQAGTHNLWKGDCAQNDCANQAGNWTPNRAGWCPGEAVDPFIFNLEGMMNAGFPIAMDYQLEPYTNLLNTGYNSGSHTEPHYRIAGFLIEQSDSRYGNHNNLRADVVSVDVNGGNFQNLTFEFKNTGTEAVAGVMASYFVNGVMIAEEVISETIMPGASYTHTFTTVDGFTTTDDNLIFGVISASNDENSSDDATMLFIDESLVDVNELFEADINIFPNPSAGLINLELSENMLNGQIEIFDTQGKMITNQSIESLNTTVTLAHRGLYMVSLRSKDGHQFFRKIVVE